MPKYDLFISHANADSAWVNGYLLDALQQAGVNYHTETAFELGKPRIIEFENAIRASRRTLLILSPDYLGDDSHQFIDVLIQTYGLETATWPLIPLILHPVSLPLRLKTLVQLDATNADERERAIERLCADLQRPAPSLAAKPVCPYPGMRSFSEAESQYFFGRKPEIQELLEGPHLRSHRFVTIIGPSGSGKSSLVFAGLLPALKQSGLFGAGEWQVHSMRPGEIPLTTLKQVLGCEPSCFGNEGRFPETLATPQQRLLLIIDQFEELFTTAKQEAIPFQQALQSLLKVPHCYMVLTVRADFYPELMTCLLWKTIQKHRQEVVPLDEAGLREAIVKPADSVEVFVETALVERLVADAAGEPGILPFVQETLALLWERLERRFLPLMAYEALVLPRQAYNWDGDKPLTGLQVAMANRADATLADLEDQAIARRLFLRLIQFGEGRPDTRRQQSVAALRSADDDVEQFNTTLEHLVAQRLLTRSAIESEADGQVDIAHEALINGWQQLQQWLKERRQAELTRRQLETKVAHWEGLKRAGGLLDVVELAEAKNWLDRSDAKELGYSEDLLTLLQASRAAIEATEREKEIAAKKLAEQRDQALRTQSLFLADLARQETETGNATNGILLALEALPKDMSVPKRPYVSEAEVQLYSAAFNHRERLVLQGHKDYVNNASFSPDGQHAVTASKDGTARLWDAKDGSLLAVFKGDDEDAVNNVFFSPDGRCIYNAARLLDAKDGSVLAVLKGHGGNRVRVHEASLSPNGQRIVTVAVTFGGFVVQLWNTQDGSPIAVLKGHKDEVTNASFSPDGLRIVTASNDNTARLWDAKDGSLLAVLKGHEDAVNNAAFSPDGQRIVTASNDNTARLWDAKDGSLTVILKRLWDAKDSSRIVVLKGHEDRVNNAAFSPDGLSIVTASNDNTARLWNAKDGSLLTVLQGHEDAVRNVAFSPNGQRIVTASNDNIALWDAKNGSLLAMLKGHENDVKKADFSPDGQFIVTASDDKTARLWDAKDSPLLTVLNGHKNRVNRASFSPDGQRIVTASNDNTARLWDAKDGSLLAVLKGHEDAVNRASFSPDGQRIVTASNDKTARLWDAKDGSLLNVLKLHKDLVANVFFSPDGQGIVTISHGNITRLWDAKDGSLLNVGRVKNSSFNPDGLHNSSFSPNGLLRIVMSLSLNAWLQNAKDYSQSTELKGHKGIIFKASFSPDGQHIVTASSDNTAMLWDGKDGSQLAVLKGHTDQVHDASFSPDGERIVTASIDGTARIWRFFPTTQALIDHANQIVPRYLTPEQRKQFFLPPDPSYDLIEEGEKLAKQRNIKAATAKFKEAKAVAPCHKFLNYPKDKAREIAAMSLIEKGDELVRRGRIEEAVEQFKQAQKVDERFKFGDIEDYSKRFKHD